MAEFQRRIPTWVRETDNNNIDFELVAQVDSVDVDFKIIEVRLHLSADGGAGDLTITLESNDDPVYNVNLVTQDMTTVQDFVWRPTPRALFQSGDKIKIVWANASTRVYGLEVIWAHVRDGD